MFKNLDKVVVQQNIPKIILRLIDVANDIKKEVKQQTRICFEEICRGQSRLRLPPLYI